MKIILHFLYKGIKVLSEVDSQIKKDIKFLPSYYKIKLETDLNNPLALCLMIIDGKVQRIKKKNNDNNFDLIIKFKHNDLAFKVLMGKKSIANAYSEHSFQLFGNICEAMVFTRILERVEGYLFPKFINKKILKEPIEREISMIKTYILCLFKG